MKNIFVLTICVIIYASSCKKKDPTPENTISITIDGVNENFTKIIYAGIGNTASTSKSSMLITGINPSNNDLIDLQIDANSKIAKGDYSNADNLAVSVNYGIGTPSSTLVTNEYKTDVNKYNSTTITIISLSDTKVTGTFSGRLISGDGKNIKIVTDGKFNIDFK